MKQIKKIPVPQHFSSDPRLGMVQRVSRLMDEEFSIGGFRFGLDPVLNFIPVAGHLAGYLVSGSLILTMLKHGASGKLVLKMMGNATLDALVGAIPVLGWIFDFAFKANTRNLKLLKEYYTEGKHEGSAAPYIIPLLLLFLVVLAAIIILGLWLIRLLVDYLDNQLLPAG